MIEQSHARQIHGYVHAHFHIEQRHVRGNARRAQHRHQQRRLVLAVAVTLRQRLRRIMRQNRRFAEFDACVTDLAIEIIQNDCLFFGDGLLAGDQRSYHGFDRR